MAKRKPTNFRKAGKTPNQNDFKHRRKEFKKRLQKGEKSTSIVLKNLPFSVKVGDIEKHFQRFGDICSVKLMTKKGGKLTGNGFVHFNSVDSAETAIKQCSGEDFMGRKLWVEWAMPLPADEKPLIKNEKENSAEKSKSNIRKVLKEEVDDDDDDDDDDTMANTEESWNDEKHINSRDYKAEKANKFSSTNNPSKEQSGVKKKGRIIVRNLSFKTTEEKLMNHFKNFGAISEVKLLKKEDGKLVGCGFVQFEKKLSAIKAIQERNNKPFLGRPIICDWAVPKQAYLNHVKSEIDHKEGEKSFHDIKIKEEPQSDDSDSEVPIKMEPEVDSDAEDREPKEDNGDDDDNDDDDDDGDGDDDDDDDEDDYYGNEEKDGDDFEDDDDDDSEKEDKHKILQRNKKSVETGHLRENKKPKVISNDVTQGCTVFIKNIPFSATNDDLVKCLNQFGHIEYALICVDQLTEHSKGTGFCKFKKKDDAEACLQASGELMIQDEVVEVLKAIPREDVKSLDETKKQKQVKDKRHLYLVREGVILAGSPAAKDVSVSDMEKRLKVEQWKTQMLRNLNMFVSNTRLVVYNVPLSWTDGQVRQLFKDHAGPGAVIKEARIMKDMRNVDANGVPKSKEFAFVHFTEHRHALQALRSINNNPDVFTKGKRPIVSFSIENKAIHKIKEKRMQKSRQAIAEKQNQSNVAHSEKKGTNKRPGQSHNHNSKRVHPAAKESELGVDSKVYTGVEAKPGNKKMRSKFKLKTQAAVHQKNVKESKRKQKLEKKIQNRNLRHKGPQPKKKRIEDDSFHKLVDKYKAQLMSSDYQKRWYE